MRRDDATICGAVDATDGCLATEQILGEENGRTAFPEGKGEAVAGRRGAQRIQEHSARTQDTESAQSRTAGKKLDGFVHGETKPFDGRLSDPEFGINRRCS
jgi:hypothetical protein